MSTEQRRTDWVDVIVGVLLVIAGIFVLSNLFEAYLALASLLGIILVIRGILLIVRSMRIRSFTNRRVSGILGIVVGVLIIIAGIYLMFNPALSLVTLGTLVGVWFIVEGFGNILDIHWSRRLSRGLWVLQIILSILMVAAGFFLLTNWLAGGLTAATLMGIALLLNGAVRVIAGFMGD